MSMQWFPLKFTKSLSRLGTFDFILRRLFSKILTYGGVCSGFFEKYSSSKVKIPPIWIGSTSFWIGFCLILNSIHSGQAAPCCARNSATPFLIVGNDEAQVNMGYSYSGVVAKADTDGVPYFKSDGAVERIQTTRCDAAFLLSDLLQTGVSVPLIQNTLGTTSNNASAMGIGDVRVSMGYEVLPAWSYSRWKPQAFLFTLLTLPTGRSGYESTHPRRVDITGNGFFSVGMGGLFIKRWTRWDVFAVPEAHYSLPRSFDPQGVKVDITPGWGGSFGVGAGFSPGGGALRFGFRLHPRYDQGVVSSTLEMFSISTFGKPIASCDTGFDLSYLISTHDTAMLSYTDQTLLGVALNTNLSRTLSLSYQHRWER